MEIFDAHTKTDYSELHTLALAMQWEQHKREKPTMMSIIRYLLHIGISILILVLPFVYKHDIAKVVPASFNYVIDALQICALIYAIATAFIRRKVTQRYEYRLGTWEVKNQEFEKEFTRRDKMLAFKGLMEKIDS